MTTHSLTTPAHADDPAHVERAVLATLAPWRRGAASGRLWVALSGGLDSTVLLHAARGWPNVCAVHLNHGLHRDAASWARHSAAAAARFGVRYREHALDIDGAGNLEANARRARYRAWRVLLDAGDVLLLGHHADDQAETRLWQCLTGRRMDGMPAARAVGDGRLVRPLLTVRRVAIRAYAKRFGLRWIEDPANADPRFDRNFIRHRLAPLVERSFPDAYERLTAPRPTPAPSLAPLPSGEANAQRIENWLLAAGLPLPRRAIAEIVRQSAAAPDRSPAIRIAPQASACRYRGHWHLVRPTPPWQGDEPIRAGQRRDFAHGTLTWRVGEAGLRPGAMLRLRVRQGGERIALAGRGVGKSFKALCREARIPPWRRGRWPLLFDEPGRLVAVPGLGVAANEAVAGGAIPHWRPAADALTGPLPGEETP